MRSINTISNEPQTHKSGSRKDRRQEFWVTILTRSVHFT